MALPACLATPLVDGTAATFGSAAASQPLTPCHLPDAYLLAAVPRLCCFPSLALVRPRRRQQPRLVPRLALFFCPTGCAVHTRFLTSAEAAHTNYGAVHEIGSRSAVSATPTDGGMVGPSSIGEPYSASELRLAAPGARKEPFIPIETEGGIAAELVAMLQAMGMHPQLLSSSSSSSSSSLGGCHQSNMHPSSLILRPS